MATRSRIGIENPDGTIESIYCHWDGYLDHNGYILQTHYQETSRIRELMALGDLSVLGSEIGKAHDFDQAAGHECNAYGRDRGERDVGSKTHTTREALLTIGEEYTYLYAQGQWLVHCYATNGNWRPLLEMLLGEDDSE